MLMASMLQIIYTKPSFDISLIIALVFVVRKISKDHIQNLCFRFYISFLISLGSMCYCSIDGPVLQCQKT